MTQTLEAPASNVSIDTEQYLAYSLPEAEPTVEDLIRAAPTVVEGLHYFEKLEKTNPLVEPETKLALLLDLVETCSTQQAPLDTPTITTLRQHIVNSAVEIASGERVVKRDGAEEPETIAVEPELIDAYLLEQAASSLDAYPADQHIVIEACTTTAKQINARTPGLAEDILESIERYTHQEDTPIDPNNPNHHATLDEVRGLVEHPKLNQAMSDYEQRRAELDMIEGTLSDGAPAPRFAPPSERATIEVDADSLRREQAAAKAERIRRNSGRRALSELTIGSAVKDDAVKVDPRELFADESSQITRAA